MVAFRKVFPVLAIVALLLGTAITASAQPTVRCQTNAGVPNIVRGEGLTELVGDVELLCTGGTAQQPFLVNFQIFLNTNITSRYNSTAQLSEALLLIDNPGTPANPNFCVSPNTASNSAGVVTTGTGITQPSGTGCVGTVAGSIGQPLQGGTYNVFRATRGNQPGAANEQLLVWQGIPVVPPGTNTRSFRFTNIRANASSLLFQGGTFPNQIFALVTINPQNTLPIDNSAQVQVGLVQQGLNFQVRGCPSTGTGTTGFSLVNALSCRSQDRTLAGVFSFGEGFPTAFRPRIAAGQAASIPNTPYNSESGFVQTGVPLLNTDRVGEADSGTRLAIRFTGLPAGVRVFVAASARGGVVGTSDAVLLQLTGTAGESVIGTPTVPTAPTSSTTVTCGGSSASPVVEITGGLAVWEVTASNPSAIDTFEFPFAIQNPQGLAASTTPATVQGTFAPFYAPTGAAILMSGTLPIPRFTNAGTPVDVFRVNPCVTNLLFPFVTTEAGFETGIAISNTSAGPTTGTVGASVDDRMSGTCTLNYFGRLPNGNPPTRTSETTNAAVDAGRTITLALGAGAGDLGLQGVGRDFRGYVIAQCQFLYAHGFAFMTDSGFRVAEGYLAVVLDGGTAANGRIRGNELGEARAH